MKNIPVVIVFPPKNHKARKAMNTVLLMVSLQYVFSPPPFPGSLLSPTVQLRM